MAQVAGRVMSRTLPRAAGHRAVQAAFPRLHPLQRGSSQAAPQTARGSAQVSRIHRALDDDGREGVWVPALANKAWLLMDFDTSKIHALKVRSAR
jgi:hypothetical protein